MSHRQDLRPVIDRRVIDGVVFDMDGVVTDTASVHAAAWKRLFDDYLDQRRRRGDGPADPFDIQTDYRAYVDGKPRYDGVRDFLASRGISLPPGDPADPPDRETICGLGNRKNGYFLDRLHRGGAKPFPSTVEFVHRLQAAGFRTAIISASENMGEVLDAAGVGHLFPVRVDGTIAAELRLPGKPDPAIFLEATRRMGTAPERTAVVEDARAGVEAGRRGRFALVIGVDRVGQRDALLRSGAHFVVAELSEVRLVSAPGGRQARRRAR
jgi:alpha,alpha-trehalase